MEIFIVFLHDRHTDPQISVHQTREGADKRIDELKSEYDEVTWSEKDYGRSAGWLRYLESHDDGPNMRIQAGTLEP